MAAAECGYRTGPASSAATIVAEMFAWAVGYTVVTGYWETGRVNAMDFNHVTETARAVLAVYDAA